MTKATDPKHDGFFNDSFVRRYADKVTELRFSNTVKIVKRTFNGNAGWMLLVEGPVGGHAMNFADQTIYPTQHRDYDVFKDPAFFTQDIWSFENLINDLVENLGERERVVDPSRGFMSRFLNQRSFERQLAYWQSEEAQIELKAR